MRERRNLAILVALPGLSLAVAGLFHPSSLNYDTAVRWYVLHIPGLLVFPLLGFALATLVRGRNDPLALVIKVSAYVYATFYTALDVVSGIGAGYVTRQLGPDVPRPDEIRFMFDIGGALGDVGEWALIACVIGILVDQMRRYGVYGVPAIAMIPAAWLVSTDHIFSPWGVFAMAVLGIANATLVLTNAPEREVDWARKLDRQPA